MGFRDLAVVVAQDVGAIAMQHARPAREYIFVWRGKGKEQVQLMVRRLLPGCTIDEPDAADALAVAICHAHHAGTVRAWQARAATPAAGTPPVASPVR